MDEALPFVCGRIEPPARFEPLLLQRHENQRRGGQTLEWYSEELDRRSARLQLSGSNLKPGMARDQAYAGQTGVGSS